MLHEEVIITPNNAPQFVLNEKDIDIWSEAYERYHSKHPVEYVKEKILETEKKGLDALPDVVGKAKEKELIKNALLSGSAILLKGKRGYGKTTISKAIAKLLPEKLLAIRDCKIYDDPTHPTCFSCKKKVLEKERVELTWIPRIWVRIPGDPMLTTRQLIGGISIQRIREGFDLDHPEVFIPGRTLKANRGVGYFDELGAVPSSLQTLLHELFEEHQVSTLEGDIVPFRLSALELASTNPANYRGTNPIKEPLLDRMEEIEIGPPDTLEEEIEIGRRNMHIVRIEGIDPKMPWFHMKILARAVRYARNKEKSELARKIESEPSCRATIKLFDHVKSKAVRRYRDVPLLSDYGNSHEIVKLALQGRIEVEYGSQETKDEIIERLLDEGIKTTCREVYDLIPSDRFIKLIEELNHVAEIQDGEKFLSIELRMASKLKSCKDVCEIVGKVAQSSTMDDEVFLSAFEIMLHSMSLCTPKLIERKDNGYLMHELIGNEA